MLLCSVLCLKKSSGFLLHKSNFVLELLLSVVTRIVSSFAQKHTSSCWWILGNEGQETQPGNSKAPPLPPRAAGTSDQSHCPSFGGCHAAQSLVILITSFSHDFRKTPDLWWVKLSFSRKMRKSQTLLSIHLISWASSPSAAWWCSVLADLVSRGVTQPPASQYCLSHLCHCLCSPRDNPESPAPHSQVSKAACCWGLLLPGWFWGGKPRV